MAGVFVTVGTTKFDGLIQAVDSLAVAEELASRGYQSLVVQVNFTISNPFLWLFTKLIRFSCT